MFKKYFLYLSALGFSFYVFCQDTLYRQSYNSGVSFNGNGPIYELRDQRDTILRYFVGSHRLALKSSTANGLLDGPVEKYYPNGQIYELSKYDSGLRVDTIKRWHRNGGFMGLFVPTESQGEESLGKPALGRVITFYDSLGDQTVVNGTGELYSIHPINFEYEKGKVVNGYKDGLWEGGSILRGRIFQEEYENGEFIEGNTVDDEGNRYYYKELEESAGFAGGIEAFYKFLSENLRYPRRAQRMGIQGRVFIFFIVEKDGSLSNIRVVKGIGAGCDEESVRVMSLSPKWNPGKQRGKVVRQAMIQNILFKFN